MAGRTSERVPPEPPRSDTIARLTVAIDMLTKAIDRLDRETVTLCSDARSDFRLLFGALIASTLGLAGLIAKSAHWF